ncbi:MAG: sigma-70 family RNA polymerase sigma factor [Acidobacteria bacterium]|nr:sigma-70 family RNA polymerase sigma factor [Acidobacteriota bacterium]
MNTSLLSELKTANESERKQFLHDLLLQEAAPLIRKVLRQRLGLYVNQQGANPQQPDAENLYQDILMRLLQRSQDWLADGEKNAIHNYRNLVITTATNACHDYLRAKAPNRARLKNRLRELFARHQDFKLWQGAIQEQLCGFTVWEGEAKSSTAMEQIRKWQTFPDSFAVAVGDVQSFSLTQLVAEILQQADGPVELEAMTKLLTTLLGTQDHPLESLEQEQEATDWQPIDPGTNAELRLEDQARLQSLWEEIKQLPAQQRAAVCLSMTDQNGNDLFSILLEVEAVSWTQLASDFDLSPDEFIDLLRQLPMDNAGVANYLGTTRAMVNKWRWRGLQQLRTRLRQEK